MSVVNRITSIEEIDDVWRGAVKPVPTSESSWSDRFDPGLREAATPQHPLILIGRNSNSSGRKGARDAADDLLGAATLLLERHGWDVRGLLPTRDQLAGALMSSGVVVHSEKLVEGQKHSFINRFILFDLREHGLVLSLSAGSAKSLTLKFDQPHVSWLGRLVEDDEVRPGALFAKREDRIYREGWAVGGLMHRLRAAESQRPVWVADGMSGKWDLAPGQDIVRFVKAQGAQQEAEAFDAKRTKRQRELTGSSMVNFQVPYALAHGAPPGTYRFRDEASRRFILSIDSPALYPERHDIHGLPLGVPQVFDANGNLADQAATVQWLLANLGHPGRGFAELWPLLCERRYSNETLRQQHGQGPGAYYGGPTKPFTGHSWDPAASWSRSIVENLDLYETGKMVRSLGSGHPAVVVENVFPPGGKWAEPADFARIRQYLRRRRTSNEKVNSWSWSGLPVTVNGISGRIRQPSDSSPGAPVRWGVALDAPLSLDGARTGSGFAPTIPDDELTAGIMAGLKALSGQPLARALVEDDHDARSVELASQLATLDSQLSGLQRRSAARRADVYAYGPNGESLLPESVRRQLLSDLEADAVAIETLTEDREALADEQAALGSSCRAPSGGEVDELQEVVRGLADPRHNSVREGLRRLLTRLDFFVTPIRRNRLHGYAVRFEGEFTIRASSGPYLVPFEGAYESGAASEAELTTASALRALRAGELPMGHRPGSRDTAGVVMALQSLGVANPDQFRWRACEDTTLLRLVMATLFPHASSGLNSSDDSGVLDVLSDVAFVADFSDVESLMTRIRHIYRTTGTRRWIKKDEADMEVQCMIASISRRHDDLIERPSTATYTPRQLNGLRQRLKSDPHRSAAWVWPTMEVGDISVCPTCQGPWLVPMLFAEASGYVCLECRRDAVGVTWPTRFDAYVAKRDLWLAAGAPLAQADDDECPRPHRPEPRSRRRCLSGLNAAERDALVDLYVHRLDLKVADIARSHDIDVTALMALVREAGAPTRYGKTLRRWEATDPARPGIPGTAGDANR